LDALHDELAGLRNQLSEMEERVDFAERLFSAEPMTIGENCRRETMELHPARSP
jgi:hypothetical protein